MRVYIFYAAEIQDLVVLSVILDVELSETLYQLPWWKKMRARRRWSVSVKFLIFHIYSFSIKIFVLLWRYLSFCPWPPLELTVIGGFCVSHTHLVSHMFNTGLKKKIVNVFSLLPSQITLIRWARVGILLAWRWKMTGSLSFGLMQLPTVGSMLDQRP